jgi:two-component system, chemotaxis family, chemotaxis protein CheY
MLKVVVMDANAISRNLLTSVLTGGGHEVVGAFNTSGASIAAMAKLQPQLVCIDIGSADEESLGKLDLIRHELPKTLLFLVSSGFEAATVQAAVARGVQGFIVKPFKSAAVLENIRNTILKLARRHREGVGDQHS